MPDVNFWFNVMKKSVVGDPIFWPGLVYSPININGLLFALGTVTGQVGLLFEEFSEEDDIAICRKKTETGWQKITAALAFRSSEFNPGDIKPDLLICWIDDAKLEDNELRVMALSEIIGKTESGRSDSRAKSSNLADILPVNSAEDLLNRGEAIMGFEETVRQLDDRIKKIKGG